MNQPTEPFRGAANAIYGDRGPRRAAPDYAAARKPNSTPPESLQDHIDDTLAHVDLSASQKRALRSELLKMCRDISFIRCVAEQAHGAGPHSDAAAGIPMDQGRPL
jgi:hypothetical protein